MRQKFRTIIIMITIGCIMQLLATNAAVFAAAELPQPAQFDESAISLGAPGGPKTKVSTPTPNPAPGSTVITVDPRQTIRPVQRQILGINTNYLTDHAAVRKAGQGYTGALRELGVKSLRYPEGEMADAYLWSVAPFTQPMPTLARTGPQEWPSNDPRWVDNGTTFNKGPMNFDEFMSHSKAIGAEPTLVVAFDSMYKPATAGGQAPSKQLLLDTAVAWVRYANVVKGYNVKYWEIGNESYLDAYNGGATARDYANDLILFARAMKQVDPSIQIGANGPDGAETRGERDSRDLWWQTVLQIAAPEIDFLAVHSYPAWEWGGYEYYRTHTPTLTSAADSATAALARWAPQHAQRIRIAVTEMNSADWSEGGWASDNNNSLGHALVLFEMIGAYLQHPQVDHAQIWNTRWIYQDRPDLWNTLDANNGLLASGRALAIWGQFLQGTMVQSSNAPYIRTFASVDPVSGKLSIFLINKDTSAQRTTVALANYPAAASGERWQMGGTSPDDKAPTWGRISTIALQGGALNLILEPNSITVLTLAP